VLLFLFSLFVLASCTNKTDGEKLQEQQNELFRFREYISQVSDHVISTREPLLIKLIEPVEGWTVGKELDASWVTLDPSATGKLTVLDGQTISFLPEKPLKQDTEYEVKFQLGKVKEVASDLKEFTFHFKTIAQDFIVSTEPVGSYTGDYQYINGTIRSSDIMELEKAKQLVVARLNGNNLAVKFPNTNALGKFFEFKIDSIKRPIEDEKVEIYWNGSSIGVDDKGENTITLPGKNSFSVTDIELVNEEVPYILINFSDPLKKSQNQMEWSRSKG
jgi:hypothetical protein